MHSCGRMDEKQHRGPLSLRRAGLVPSPVKKKTSLKKHANSSSCKEVSRSPSSLPSIYALNFCSFHFLRADRAICSRAPSAPSHPPSSSSKGTSR